jgi:DNA (cytosine-5)-methyltransferase 1
MVEDVFNVSPTAFVRKYGRPDIFVGSPDCTHFSRAKGRRPLDTKRRALANVFLLWADEIRPRILVLENVEEFLTWGPLLPDGRPDPQRVGEDFRAWCARLRQLGYVIEWRLLKACDYGAPTSRKRLFIIARCDGRPICWPTPTHGPGREFPHLPASSIIDWSLEVPSIFDRRRGPLSPNTLNRIAAGIRRFVVESADPFLLCLTHGGRLEPINRPLNTVTTANRGERALVVPQLVRPEQLQLPYLMTNTTGHAPGAVDGPVPSLTTGKQQNIVMASLALLSQGERRPGECRAPDLANPLPTVVGGGNRFGLVATHAERVDAAADVEMDAALDVELGGEARADGHGDGQAPDTLTAAHLLRHFGTSKAGAPVSVPHPTVMPEGAGKSALISTRMTRLGRVSAETEQTDRASLVAAFIAKHYTGAIGSDLRSPLATITGVDHNALVGAYLDQYNGTAIGRNLNEPLGTVTSKERFSVVTVMISGVPYVIRDIGMRMLTAEELKLAQGFPREYILEGTKTDCIQAIGNAVPPPFMRALIWSLTADIDMW